MKHIVVAFALMLAVLAGVAWYYKVQVKTAFVSPAPQPPPSAQHPAQNPDILYKWVDKKGVTHYDQKPGRGEVVAYDGSRITVMEPITPEQRAQLVAVETAEPAEKKGSALIHAMRRELQEGRAQMQAAKDASKDL
jgi:hypothetical protein